MGYYSPVKLNENRNHYTWFWKGEIIMNRLGLIFVVSVAFVLAIAFAAYFTPLGDIVREFVFTEIPQATEAIVSQEPAEVPLEVVVPTNTEVLPPTETLVPIATATLPATSIPPRATVSELLQTCTLADEMVAFQAYAEMSAEELGVSIDETFTVGPDGDFPDILYIAFGECGGELLQVSSTNFCPNGLNTEGGCGSLVFTRKDDLPAENPGSSWEWGMPPFTDFGPYLADIYPQPTYVGLDNDPSLVELLSTDADLLFRSTGVPSIGAISITCAVLRELYYSEQMWYPLESTWVCAL